MSDDCVTRCGSEPEQPIFLVLYSNSEEGAEVSGVYCCKCGVMRYEKIEGCCGSKIEYHKSPESIDPSRLIDVEFVTIGFGDTSDPSDKESE